MRIALLLAIALAGCATVRPPQAEPVAPPSHSVAEADASLARAVRERALAEAQFNAGEQACYTKFLVNRCLEQVREQRRATLAQLHVVEIEAEHFKRKAAADARDRELAKAEKEFAAEQARLAAEPPPPLREVPPPAPPKRAASSADPVAEHAARLKRQDAREQAGAARRAASVAAFEKRKRESEQRQREIAEKKKKAAQDAH